MTRIYLLPSGSNLEPGVFLNKNSGVMMAGVNERSNHSRLYIQPKK